MAIKLSDIHYSSDTYVPVADCVDEECSWNWRPSGWGTKPGAAKDAAKRHVQANPSHAVQVIARTVSEYWVPKGNQP